jgi:hypothetical protein
MKILKKIILAMNIIILVENFFLPLETRAAGFIVEWKPFVVDQKLELGAPDLIPDKNTSWPESFLIYDRDQNFFYKKDDDSYAKEEKKSIWDNVKIIFFSSHERNENKKVYHFNQDDDKELSTFMNALASLIHDDSKMKSLETIGKILEPQVNFYVEF